MPNLAPDAAHDAPPPITFPSSSISNEAEEKLGIFLDLLGFPISNQWLINPSIGLISVGGGHVRGWVDLP